LINFEQQNTTEMAIKNSNIELFKYSVGLDRNIRMVKSREKEKALEESDQIPYGGIMVIVQYGSTRYVKITDGKLKFSEIAKEGEVGGIQTINGKSGSSVTLGSSDINTQYIIGGDTQNGTIQDAMTGYGNQIGGLWNDFNALAPVAATGSYGDLTDKPTLGTAAAADTDDFATSAQGAKADSAVQPADIPQEVQDWLLSLTGATTAGNVLAVNSNGDGFEFITPA